MVWRVYRKRKMSNARRDFRRAYRSTLACLAAVYKIDISRGRSLSRQFLTEWTHVETHGPAYRRGVRAACRAAFRKFDPSQQEQE